MPRRGKIGAMPEAVQAWLKQSLLDGNFSGDEELAAALNTAVSGLRATVYRENDKLIDVLVRGTKSTGSILTFHQQIISCSFGIPIDQAWWERWARPWANLQ